MALRRERPYLHTQGTSKGQQRGDSAWSTPTINAWRPRGDGGHVTFSVQPPDSSPQLPTRSAAGTAAEAASTTNGALRTVIRHGQAPPPPAGLRRLALGAVAADGSLHVRPTHPGPKGIPKAARASGRGRRPPAAHPLPFGSASGHAQERERSEGTEGGLEWGVEWGGSDDGNSRVSCPRLRFA